MAESIDIDHLAQYVGDDAALRDEILGIFEDQAMLWIAELDPCADDEGWRNAAHALKGASRGVGAWAVGDLCEAAEALVGNAADGRAERAALLDDLQRHIAAAVACARRLRQAA